MPKTTTTATKSFPMIKRFTIKDAPYSKITDLVTELSAAPDNEAYEVRERREFTMNMLQAVALVLCEWKRAQHVQTVAAPFVRAAKRLEVKEADEPELGPRGRVPKAYHQLVARLGGLVNAVELAANKTPDGSLEALLGMTFQVHRAAKLYGVASDGRGGLRMGVSWMPVEKVTQHGGDFSVHLTTYEDPLFTAAERKEIRDAEIAAWTRVTSRKAAEKAAKEGA